MRASILIIFLCLGTMAFGQLPGPKPTSPSAPGLPIDSLLMEYSDFLSQVMQYHPLAQQADLKPLMAEAGLKAARGGFDPKLSSNLSQKAFDGKNYFRVLESDLKVPTWGGVTVYGNYRQANGEFLNPELYTPDAGLVSAGVEVNLGKGLFIDKRRAALRKAQVYVQSTEAQRTLMLNELIFEATESYWKWVQAYNEFLIYQQAAQLAATRLQGVISSYRQGDKPAIDTTEALIQFQNRTYLLTKSRMKVNSFRLELSNYLWDDAGNPLELVETATAPKIDTQNLTESETPGQFRHPESPLTDQHPMLRYYSLQVDALQIEQRYKREQLKPKASVKYNFLSGVQNVDFNPTLQNYKWGFDVSIPLFLRKERGELAKVKLEMQQANLNLERKRWHIETKLEALSLKIDLTGQQIDLYTDAVRNYQILLDGESRKFESGESSLFMVNSREQNLIKAELQLLSELTAYPILVADYGRVAGLLGQ